MPDPDFKVSLSDFIKLYKSDKVIASSRDAEPAVIDNELVELYSYQIIIENPNRLAVNGDGGNEDIVIGHQDYTLVSEYDYHKFMHDMAHAFATKERPS